MIESDLQRLDALRQQGVLSDQSYWEARSRLFSGELLGTPDQSWSPPAPARHRQARARRRRRWIAAATVVLLGAAAGGYLLTRPPGVPHTKISGTYVMTNAMAAAANCEPQDGGIGNGSTVTLVSAKGAVLGTTRLVAGAADNDRCTFHYSFAGVRADLESYGVRVADDRVVTAKLADLKTADWNISSSDGPTTHAVDGTFNLYDIDTWASDCVTSLGYSDIGPGTPVVLRNQDGTILDSTSLDEGVATDDGVCTFTFAFLHLRDDQRQYSVEVGNRGAVVFSRDDMISNNWTMSIRLGH